MLGTAGAVRGNEHGAALVELALCIALLALISLGVTDVARAYVLSEQVRAAASEAAMYAASHPGQLHNVSNTPCADPENATWRGSTAGGPPFRFTFSPDLAASDCNPSPMPTGLAPRKRLKVTATARLTLSTPLVEDIVGKTIHVTATVCVAVAGPPSTIPCS